MKTATIDETTAGNPVVKLSKTRAHQVYKLADGTRVPGASTIAKIGDDPGALLHWAWKCGCEGIDYKKARDKAADIGTIAHFMIECHLKGDTPDLSEFGSEDIDRAETSFLKFLDWWQGEGFEVISPEVQLVSETFGYGGTIDAPVRDKSGNVCILDWKTSKGIYDSHLIQTAAYEKLFAENYPDLIPSRRAVARIGKEDQGDFEVRWFSDSDKYFEVFKAQLALYKARKKAGVR